MKADLLIELADHLETGNLHHDVFDFNIYSSINTSCGTVGCALGEATHLFKVSDEYLFRNISCASGYFGISNEELKYIFYPPNPWYETTCPLPVTATKLQVAKHIRDFVAKKQAIECPMCSGSGKINIKNNNCKQHVNVN